MPSRAKAPRRGAGGRKKGGAKKAQKSKAPKAAKKATEPNGQSEPQPQHLPQEQGAARASTPGTSRQHDWSAPSTSTPGPSHCIEHLHEGHRDSGSLKTPATPARNRTGLTPLTPRELRSLHRSEQRQDFWQTFDDEDVANPVNSFQSDNTGNMSNQQAKWREEQVLVICPGSQTTMVQLGVGELMPPMHRIPTRMFKSEESGEYRPYHTYKRKKATSGANAENAGEKEATDGAKNDSEDEWEYVEDRDSVEGAIYPMVAGQIVNMPAFLAFLDHVHGLITATYHNTPIVLVTSPQWGRGTNEKITRYIFEKTKTPALCLLHSSVASQYGVKWTNLTVVDIGYEKVDITCLYDSNIVAYRQVGDPDAGVGTSGGEIFTQKLQGLLKDKGFTYDMAEQLKRSPICEVLPFAPEFENDIELPSDTQQSSTQVAQGATITETPKTTTEAAKPTAAADGSAENGEFKESDEGVLDVANIVTSGNTREFLAKREKEKAEKAKAKKQAKGQESEAGAAKPVRLANSKRVTNIFHYEELVHEDVQVPVSNAEANHEAAASTNGATQAGEPPAAAESAPTGEAAATSETQAAEGGQAADAVKTVSARRTRRVRKDIEVGLERFIFAERREIDRITDTIYATIQSIDDMYKRPACWDNIVFVGNGSRLKGLKENIMQTLIARHLISPSTATIFTSELPSNMATPTGTGAQTPTGSFTGPLPTTSSVNPLLQAATTASLGVPGQAHAAASNAGDGASHHFHSQTPTSIKMAPMPTYITEWAKHGFEEAMLLGACICGRMAYCLHSLDSPSTTELQRYMYMSRVDYNEKGPRAIRTNSMLGGC